MLGLTADMQAAILLHHKGEIHKFWYRKPEQENLGELHSLGPGKLDSAFDGLVFQVLKVEKGKETDLVVVLAAHELPGTEGLDQLLGFSGQCQSGVDLKIQQHTDRAQAPAQAKRNLRRYCRDLSKTRWA